MNAPARSGARPHGLVHVLVIDDSAVARQTMSAILSRDPNLRVETAADPIFARQRMARTRFQVILLDLEMPRMDGLTFLREIMGGDAIPVIVCSGCAPEGSRAAIQALEEGAVAVLDKPSLGARNRPEETAMTLIDAVHGAAQARVRRRVPAPRSPARSATPAATAAGAESPRPATGTRAIAPRPAPAHDPVVVIGASTGGTEALRRILGAMPGDAPGIVIVQHMPDPFVTMFAQGLDRSSPIEVRRAAAGDPVTRGRALIAPGDRHIVLARSGGGYRVELGDGPLVSRHRPSIDVLFRSTARAAGARAVGVLLTGMGSDGAEGLLEMRRAGAITIAQDEQTSIVFGMPKEAIARGAAAMVVPLDRMTDEILVAAAAALDAGAGAGTSAGPAGR